MTLDIRFKDLDTDIQLRTRFTAPDPEGSWRFATKEVPLVDADTVWLQIGQVSEEGLIDAWEVPVTRAQAKEIGEYFTWLGGEMR